MTRVAIASSFLAVSLLASVADAHIQMTFPPARYSMDDIKDPPCGMPGNPPGTAEATVLQAGETIHVLVNEFTDHDSHFRISISDAGDDAYVSPSDYDDYYTAPNVYLDHITDEPGVQNHDIEFTVPDLDCETCSMQVIQVMYSAQPFSEGALYYNCADIVIEGASATSGVGDTTAGGESSEGGSTAAGSEADSGITDPSGANEATASASGSEGSSGGEGGSTATVGTTEATTSDSDSAGAGDGDDDKGCGCASQPPAGSAWALALLGLLGLRRRRP
jgi:MYXO-CTERM domain-containing protein